MSLTFDMSFSFDFFRENDTSPSVSSTLKMKEIDDSFKKKHPAVKYTPEYIEDDGRKESVVINEEFSMFKSPSIAPEGCSLAKYDCYTDIVPGVYEGGLKCWEASIDLVNYLYKNTEIFEELNLHILEVIIELSHRKFCFFTFQFSIIYIYSLSLKAGCGHGLPGIFA